MKDRCDESGCGCRAADTEPLIPVTDMTLRDHYADAMLAERAVLTLKGVDK